MRLAVCDDDLAVTAKMKDIINDYVFEKKLIADVEVYHNGKELLESNHSFDVIFMDIDMKEMNGIAIAKELRETDKDVKIIFVTNYTDYQDYAFGVHAFSYLLKPVSQERIHSILNDVIIYSKQDLKCQISRSIQPKEIKIFW
jgi:DNA-binding LytR/AlgR family response regulator